MKNKRMVSLLTIILVILLVSCGGNKKPKTTDNFDTFRWPRSDLAKLIPEPKSNYGRIEWESSSSLSIIVGNFSSKDYDDYVDSCWDVGFNVDYQKFDDYFYAYNEDGYSLSLMFSDDESMTIYLDEPSAPSEKTEESTTEDAKKTEKPTQSETTTEQVQTTTEQVQTPAPTSQEEQTVSDNTIRPEIREAIDSYETSMDSYIEFMTSYDSSDLSMLIEYSQMLSDFMEMTDRFEKIADKELTIAETKYYIEVQTRVNNKLLAVSFE